MTFVKTSGEDPTQANGEGELKTPEIVKPIQDGGGHVVVDGSTKGIPGGVVGIAGGSIGGVVGEVAGGVPEGGGLGAIGSAVASVVAGGNLGDISGKVAGSIAGSAAGGDVELPIFEEKAITSSSPGKAAAAAQGAGGIAGKGAGIVALHRPGKNLEVKVASRDALDVRNFSVSERLSSLFQVNLIAMSDNPSIEFDAVVGQPARFMLHAGPYERTWSGVCNHFEQVRVEPSGLSTYQLSIVPTLWLLTQRRNHRMFQQISEPEIVQKVLQDWNIKPDMRIDSGAYKKRKYRVQYAESDFAFISRILESAGITYYFEDGAEEMKLVLSDAPQGNPKRPGVLTFLDDTSMVRDVAIEFATGVRMGQRVRPGKYTMRDHDYRRPPSYKLMKTATGGLEVEQKLERFQYTPGAFLFRSDQGDSTPVADDKGKTRADEKEGESLAKKRLDAKRGSARVCTFETSAHDVGPGVVLSMSGHPNAALAEDKTLLIVESSLSGVFQEEWTHHCEARSADVPYKPEILTPRPTVNGVESATVVGPPGEEIHTDEFGRVRVHFHWDRESKMDDNSSCWIHVTQGWAGTGFGMVHIPRVGQEVLVDFLSGDPDRPVIVGKVYTNLQKVPYKLPENKTQSGWKSNSSPGGGGYNEIMFEDKKGGELVNIQAQKDLNKLVKNNETETTGVNRTISVGKNRTLTVGENDTAAVGVLHSVTITPTPPGGMGPPAPPTTSIAMVDKQIILTTGGAAIVLDKNDISLTAAGNIMLAATGAIVLQATDVVKIDGKYVFVNCTEDPPEEIPVEEGFSGEKALDAAVTIASTVCPPLGAVLAGAQLIWSFFS